MRNTIHLLAFVTGAFITIQSCYYEYPPKAAPYSPDDVSFNTHILPIFVTHCAKSECHDGTEKPDLRAENAYFELKRGGYYNLLYPEDSKIYQAVNYSGGLSMPPDGQLSPLDRDLILIWISKGAPND